MFKKKLRDEIINQLDNRIYNCTIINIKSKELEPFHKLENNGLLIKYIKEIVVPEYSSIMLEASFQYADKENIIITYDLD